MHAYKQITFKKRFSCIANQVICVLKYSSIELLVLAKALDDNDQNNSPALADKVHATTQSF